MIFYQFVQALFHATLNIIYLLVYMCQHRYRSLHCSSVEQAFLVNNMNYVTQIHYCLMKNAARFQFVQDQFSLKN